MQREQEDKKYYVERIGLELYSYSVEDEEYAKNKYGIRQEEILDEKQFSKTLSKGKVERWCYNGLDGLSNEIIAERRIENDIRYLQIDNEIENTLKKLSKLTYKQREKIARECGAGDYEKCTICGAIREYVKDKNISTVTVSSVSLFAKALNNIVDVRNVLHNLSREGIYVYFKENGLWSGNRIHNIDIGALAALALYVFDK